MSKSRLIRLFLKLFTVPLLVGLVAMNADTREWGWFSFNMAVLIYQCVTASLMIGERR